MLRPSHNANCRVPSNFCRYPVIIETGPDAGYSAYAPDVPGCVPAARSMADVCTLIREALQLHLADAEERPRASEVLLVEV
jgi:predicted RNase H-like HicB family nuclease